MLNSTVSSPRISTRSLCARWARMASFDSIKGTRSSKRPRSICLFSAFMLAHRLGGGGFRGEGPRIDAKSLTLFFGRNGAWVVGPGGRRARRAGRGRRGRGGEGRGAARAAGG